MSGAMRKIGEYLGLVEDSRYADEYDYPEVPEHPAQHPAHHQGVVSDLDERRRGPVRNRGQMAPAPARADLSKIVTLHPRTYNEARVIGENYRAGIPVIMNLSEMDDNDAKRLVDFAAGLVFASFGTIERVTNKVFLLSPADVAVAAEEKARLLEGGFFNQS